mmetsp:Transcript_43874/g.102501  ORF Transcript_43874/g.102501 Transcript_43874/m.102501 type:complete len:523 (-) Transcript_43874:28-1596(-)
MQLFEHLGEALERLTSGHCAWNELTKAELRNLSELPEEPKSAIEGLEGLALEYSWQELHQATDGFAASRQLGSGASGTVYHGTLCEGTDAAVKVLDAPLCGGFEYEVRLLSRCRHPNVVMLLGYAEESLSVFRQRRCALVYELLHGGDLYQRLQADKPYLWQERLRTATEVCRGLAHLHKHRPKIFHRDIKSQNILFSGDGTAKIADFGLACMAADNDVHEMATSQVAGTVGYSDPLYTRTGVMSESSECYSFGQVLIELLVGRPPAVLAKDGHSCVFLSDELRPKEDRAKSRVLSRLDARAQWPLFTAAGLSTLALLCIHEDADRRPTFLEATDMLRDLVAAASAQKDELELDPGVSRRQTAAPHEALQQPEALQLESAAVLGQMLQHAQQMSPQSPQKQLLSPSPRCAQQSAMQMPTPAVPPHWQQPQALSPGAFLQRQSPRAAVQVWQPVSPGHRAGAVPVQLVHVASCPRPLRPSLGPAHAKPMPETPQVECKGLDLSDRPAAPASLEQSRGAEAATE